MLNRRDVTPSQVDMFLKQAIQRAQRLLRVPASEKLLTTPVTNPFSGLAIPGDFLKLVSLSSDGIEISRNSLPVVQQAAKNNGQPEFYARYGSKFLIGPVPYEGTTLDLVYSADFTNLESDSSENFLTLIAPDVIIYGALSYACGHFSDPRKETFEQEFVKAIVDINNQASEDELTNAQVAPSYNLNFDW